MKKFNNFKIIIYLCRNFIQGDLRRMFLTSYLENNENDIPIYSIFHISVPVFYNVISSQQC